MKEKPDILIDLLEIINEDIISNEFNALAECGVNAKLHKREISFYAALEWTIPTAIVAYVLKPYFETFLKEAGKQHYKVISEKLKAFLIKGKDLEAKLITAEKSTKKLDDAYSQSQTISILVETKTGRIIKLLFDNNLELNDWEDAIDQLLDYAVENYEKPGDNELEKLTVDFNKHKNFDYYAIINGKTKKIEFYDDLKLIKNSRSDK